MTGGSGNAGAPAPTPKPKLLQQVRDAIRRKHFSPFRRAPALGRRRASLYNNTPLFPIY